jgi:hypothetical protein
MPLAGYQPESRTIQIGPKNTMVVRGISLTDLAVLIREHMPDMEAVFELFKSVDTMKVEDLQQLILTVVTQAPGLAANVIALAAGEGDASDAEKLPMPVQVAALLEIGSLTFTEVGGVGKFTEMVAALLKTKTMSKVLTTANVATKVKRSPR